MNKIKPKNIHPEAFLNIKYLRTVSTVAKITIGREGPVTTNYIWKLVKEQKIPHVNIDGKTFIVVNDHQLEQIKRIGK